MRRFLKTVSQSSLPSLKAKTHFVVAETKSTLSTQLHSSTFLFSFPIMNSDSAVWLIVLGGCYYAAKKNISSEVMRRASHKLDVTDTVRKYSWILNPNKKDHIHESKTLMHHLVYQNPLCVAYLWKGFNKFLVDNRKNNVFHEMALAGNEATLQHMLSETTPSVLQTLMHTPNADGLTPFVLAAEQQQGTMVSVLANCRAIDINILDAQRAYMSACEQGSIDMAFLLSSCFPVDVAEEVGGYNSLELLCQIKSKKSLSVAETVKLNVLVRSAPSVDEKAFPLQRARYLSIVGKDQQSFLKIVDAWGRNNVDQNTKKTVLDYAARFNSIPVMSQAIAQLAVNYNAEEQWPFIKQAYDEAIKFAANYVVEYLEARYQLKPAPLPVIGVVA